MLTKKTVIGIGIGALGIALGSFFLIQSIISNVNTVDDTVDIAKSDVFQFDAQKHFHEFLNVTGSSFHVVMKTPSDGLQVDRDFQNEISFDWYSLQDGKHFINITNTGGTTLHVTGKLQAVQSPLIFMSHLIVISSGILIIGISAAFSVRKPRGF
ncbi:MAG: hypothetical protein KGH89_02410 [Thaumarchaeota archaeon]|nr:hypothetical protein [Nitrososphaerota archaeon]MDE1867178.1 hypothetical protein [Nitrososphaerota archaeon]